MVEKADARSDTELVAAVNGGDWQAFDALYRRYRDWVYRLAWRFCGESADAQDALQEVFVYLAGKFRAGGGLELRCSMTTLLYPAVKHTALAIKRKRCGGGRIQAMPEEVSIPAPPEYPPVSQTRRQLAAVLAGLSDPHREILLMRFVDDMAMEEIAEALAIPLGTAKSRLHHAVAAIRVDPRVRRYFEP